MLLIDNMKHIKPSQKYNSVVEQFRDLSVRIKWMRDDLKMPVIVLHHLTDGGDVSWSKDIRRDADVLLYLTRDEDLSIVPSQVNHYTGKAVVNCEVRKFRDADAGYSVKLEFDKPIQTFRDYSTAGVAQDFDDDISGDVA